MNESPILDGLFGICIGDALGVPVESSERAELRREPVTGTIGKRHPHFQAPGTWSDDSSPAPCLVESLFRHHPEEWRADCVVCSARAIVLNAEYPVCFEKITVAVQ